MADTGIFATTTEVLRKAGSDVSSTAAAEAYTNDFMTQAESFINSTTLYNWSDVYSTLNADTKGLLKEAASNIAAMYVINYDYSGFVSLSEAQTRLNVLWDRAQLCLALLKEQTTKKFIEGS